MALKTTRLVLRPQQMEDAPALFAILSDPEAMRFWHRPPIRRLTVVETLIEEQQAAMADGLCRYWTVLEDDRAIGSVDLSLIADGQAQLGFLFRRDRWGHGLAREAVAAVTAHGFAALGLWRLAAAVQTANRAAAHVLERNGFSVSGRQRDFALDGGGRADVTFYERRRSQSDSAKGA